MGSSVSVGIETKFIPYKENAMKRIVALLVIVLTMLVSMTSVVSAATPEEDRPLTVEEIKTILINTKSSMKFTLTPSIPFPSPAQNSLP